MNWRELLKYQAWLWHYVPIYRSSVHIVADIAAVINVITILWFAAVIRYYIETVIPVQRPFSCVNITTTAWLMLMVMKLYQPIAGTTFASDTSLTQTQWQRFLLISRSYRRSDVSFWYVAHKDAVTTFPSDTSLTQTQWQRFLLIRRSHRRSDNVSFWYVAHIDAVTTFPSDRSHRRSDVSF